MDIVERLRQGAGHLPDDILDAEQAMDWAAADIEKMRADMAEIWRICHIPTLGHMKAYTHFAKDFTRIREITSTYLP